MIRDTVLGFRLWAFEVRDRRRFRFSTNSYLGVSAFLIGLSLLTIQVRINYQDQDFTLSGFDNFSATLEDQGTAFKGSGKPLNIEMRARGLKLMGTNAEGNASRGSAGSYFLKDATISGNANLLMDGAVADEYAKSVKATASAPATNAPLTTNHIQSDTLKYAGTEQEGRVDFPGAVMIDSSSKVLSPVALLRKLHLTGASGNVVVSMTAGGNNALRTGEIIGPVNYSGSSESVNKQGTKETTTFEGRADSLKFDFTKEPRTLTLAGNVTLKATGTAARGDIAADTVVVTVDENLKPIKIDVTGTPAKTTFRQEQPSAPPAQTNLAGQGSNK